MLGHRDASRFSKELLLLSLGEEGKVEHQAKSKNLPDNELDPKQACLPELTLEARH